MPQAQIRLVVLWAALMLTYLLGDVLRIFAGDFTPGEMMGKKVGAEMWVLAALVMLIPIAVMAASVFVPYPAVKWLSIVASAFLILFNLAGLPYPGAYDNLLIVVGIGINALIIWQAWAWPT
jgi:hypothetical protein